MSVGSIVHQCGLDRTYTSYATVAGQGARPSAEASTGRPSSPTVNDHPQNNLLPLQGDPSPGTRSVAHTVTSRDRSGDRSQGARPKETSPVGLPQRPPSKSTHRRSTNESLTQLTKHTLQSEAANLSPQGASIVLPSSTAAATASTVTVPSLPPPVLEGATGGSDPQTQPAVSSEQTPAQPTISTAPKSDSIPANTQVTITPEMFEHFLKAPYTFYCMVGAATKGNVPQDSPKAPQ